MNFIRQHIRLISVTVIIIFLLILFYNIRILKPLEKGFSYILQPVQSVLFRNVDSYAKTFATDESSIIEENSRLKDQLIELSLQNSEATTKLSQYQEYENQLKFVNESEFNMLPAKIISRVGQGTTTQLITINQGESAGVKTGYPVLYNEGAVIGIVYATEEERSEIALITSNLIQLQGMIQNDARTPGLVHGEFSTGLAMEYILRENPIDVGGIVITNGQDKDVPQGLIIGTVQSVDDEASELFKTAKITPLVRYSSNSIVSVVIPN
ncbi:MAG: rod shape-determining protein MreC [bacterium]|nr:rod shape-determining protein MreC [bacterium]